MEFPHCRVKVTLIEQRPSACSISTSDMNRILFSREAVAGLYRPGKIAKLNKQFGAEQVIYCPLADPARGAERPQLG
jgi:hypothetical protein